MDDLSRGNEDSSDDDDKGPDWTKISSSIPNFRPSLPKRGDKEFEPASNGPTNLQAHSLNRARDAMFGALGTPREISHKSVSYAVWYPLLARAHVTRARGVLFNGLGHSVARSPTGLTGVSGDNRKTYRRTELLPEEALYLIERGSLFCWKHEPSVRLSVSLHDSETGPEPATNEEEMQGSPMTVQQAFADMIGREDLTLERYHAFAYLKRLGFNVLRAQPPSPSYPLPPPGIIQRPPHVSFLAHFFRPFVRCFENLRCKIFGGSDWWKPLDFGYWLGCARNYTSTYRALRLIPSGHHVPLHAPSTPSLAQGPKDAFDYKSPDYEIFYNVYKPNTPFRKSAPPPPDFSLVVVNARTTPLPTIEELTYLWSFLPETGPPPPRQRNRAKPPQNPNTAVDLSPQPLSPAISPSSFLTWLLGFKPEHKQNNLAQPRSPHPFAMLKAGKKTIVIGVVDNGTVGFFRFGMGAFEEMPML